MVKRLGILLIVFGFIVFISGLTGCIKRRETRSGGTLRGRSVEQVFDSHRDELLSTPGVVGVGIAKFDGKPSIVVMVINRRADVEKQIPLELDGYPVVIEVTSQFKAPGQQ